jgi:hypothetical protein
MRALIGAWLVGTALACPASAVAQLLSPNPTVLSTRPDGTTSQIVSGLVFSAMTPDARYIVLYGSSGELIGPTAPGGTLLSQQWMLFDRQTGDRRVVSVNAQGAGQILFPQPTNSGFAVSISDDANRIVFNSTATNFDPPATSGVNRCYLWDRAVGHAVALDVDPLPGLQAWPCGNITADGREVVALCSQPVANVTGFGVCVRNIDTGEIQRLAPGRGTGLGFGYEVFLRISADGSTVAFSGWQGTTAVGLTRVDRLTGTVTDVLPNAGTPPNISISGDGRFLAFASSVYDHQTGITRTAVRRPPFEWPTRTIWDLQISRDGRFVAFRTSAGEFERPFSGLPFATGRILVYRIDLATDRLEMVSRVGLDGPIANQTHDPCENPQVFSCFFNRFSPRISGDGRFVVFQFPRANLAPSYPPGNEFATQLFIKDMGPAAPLVEPVAVPLDRRSLLLVLGLALLLTGSLVLGRRN